MGARARADDEKERVLDLAVQPDDAGQAAEHLALSLLAQHVEGGRLVHDGKKGGGHRVPPVAVASAGDAICTASASACLRAMRNFHTNWPALMT
jgi:hypothetical protein